MQNKKTIFMINFARSGGTLLNRCLGMIPNTMIFSEVNEMGFGKGKNKKPLSLKKQAASWYDIKIKADEFEEQLEELTEIAQRQAKTLIIRDWTFVNFWPRQENNGFPNNQLSTYNNFNKEKIAFAFVRDAIDVWISMSMPDLDKFTKFYSKYLEALEKNKIKIFKYEKFCKQPRQEMKKICNFIGISFNEKFLEFYNFENVTGDISKNSRGLKKNEITPFKRKLIPLKKIIELELHGGLKELNREMKYPSHYFSKKIKFPNLSEYILGHIRSAKKRSVLLK